VLLLCWPVLFAVACGQRGCESFKQGAVYRIALCIVLHVPLDAESKAGRICDADRLDRAVFGHALNHDPLARIKDALSVQRVHADGLAAEDACKGAALHKGNIMALGEDDVGIWMNFTCLQAKHPVI
jgi:hypothetical protein